ncbi:hypothetical protein SLOPH_754 [Spraguea lophii 42_110]|uniref:Uncharacterized protein n=1 Tax=Spraguea lophii (strain 42_110) TaxID=1358809 RepID=S7XUE4_SPRLO|nr:hypothetical protein SLOPH_754 [Spraguea lophii 42_110]
MFFVPIESIKPIQSVFLHLRAIKNNILLSELPLFHINIISILTISLFHLFTSLIEALIFVVMHKQNFHYEVQNRLAQESIFKLNFLENIIYITPLILFILIFLNGSLFGAILYFLHRKYISYYLCVYFLIISLCAFNALLVDFISLILFVLLPIKIAPFCILFGYMIQFYIYYEIFMENFTSFIYYFYNKLITTIIFFLFSITFSYIKTVIIISILKFFLCKNT